MKKKILSMLLVTLMVFSQGVSTFAESISATTERVYSASMTVDTVPEYSTADFNEGETFYVDFNINSCPGINAATFFVKYDPKVVQAVEASSSGADFIGYNNPEIGGFAPFITKNHIDTQLNNVVSVGDSDYSECNPDGVKTAAQLGKIKLNTLIKYPNADASRLLETTNSGTLMRIMFKQVGEGSTDITLQIPPYNFYQSPYCKDPVNIKWVSQIIDTSVNAATVTLKGDNTSSNSSSSSGSSQTVETTQTTTQVTTQETTQEVTVETTTQNAETPSISTALSINPPKNIVSNIKFDDISSRAWAVDSINKLAGLGIVNGVGGTKFNPDANTKRADFIVMLVKALGLESDATDNFADVRADKYYAKSLAVAKELGIATGVGNNKFNPEGTITRQDMMVLIDRTIDKLGLSTNADTSVLNSFADSSQISPYAKDSVAELVSTGIVTGTGSNIEPKKLITRAQMSVMMAKFYDMIVK